ncbi:MAG: hypothetical protein Q9226_004357 [Calogaya cf. arnoldii]
MSSTLHRNGCLMLHETDRVSDPVGCEINRLLVAASLSALPPEVFAQVVENISKNGHLLDLALCCHGFYDLVLPKLYSHLSLKISLLKDQPTYPKLRLLVSRILSNTTLASYVRSISLDQERACQAWDNENDGNEVDSGDDRGSEGDDGSIDNAAACLEMGNEEDLYENPADMPNLFNLLQPMSVFERSEQMEGVKNNDEETLVALLVQAVPNLEAMSIEINAIKRPVFYQVFERAVAGREDSNVSPPIQSFARLQVVINNCDGSGAQTCGMTPALLDQYLDYRPCVRSTCLMWGVGNPSRARSHLQRSKMAHALPSST